MKSLITLWIIISSGICAQEIDPLSFFPSSVGNLWEHGTNSGNYKTEILKDSLVGNVKYLFYSDFWDSIPLYSIDTVDNRVYYDPSDLNLYYFKLDADSGDIWIVDSFDLGAGPYYKLANVKNKYHSFIFGKPTVIMEITFYQYQPDTIISNTSWPRTTITLASGIGEIMEFDEEGGGPQKILQGCIIDGDTMGTITTAIIEIGIVPAFFRLYQNFPNPFNPKTNIEFNIPQTDFVTLKVYDILGKEVAVLIEKEMPPGKYNVEFNGNNLSSGVYIYILKTSGYSAINKMALLK